MVWFIGIVNALLAFKLAWDWYAKNKQKRVINHTQSALIDGVIYVGSAIYLFGLEQAAGWVIIAIAYRWIFFDLLFNLLNGWPLFYCGQSSKIDRLADKLDGRDDENCALALIMKIIILIIGIWILKK
jgi:hypothetical protein